MPHTIKIQRDSPLVRVSVDGAVDVTYWRWVLYDSVKQGRDQAASRFLIDLRLADLHVEVADLMEMGSTVRRDVTPDIRVACVCRPSDGASPDPRFEDRALIDYVHVFYSEEDATRWLLDDAQGAAA